MIILLKLKLKLKLKLNNLYVNNRHVGDNHHRSHRDKYTD
jgi:hypothetical protein